MWHAVHSIMLRGQMDRDGVGVRAWTWRTSDAVSFVATVSKKRVCCAILFPLPCLTVGRLTILLTSLV